MTGRLLLLLLLLLLLPAASPAAAQLPAECKVSDELTAGNFSLPRVTKALAAKKLSVLVVGAGSSLLPGPNGAKTAYPARLQAALAAELADITVSLAVDAKSRRTAPEMVKSLPAALAAAKPALMVWQTGTVDAMEALDPDQFNAALGKGIKLAHAAGADVVFVNSQYSPRTESMIALGTYEENLRWVAVQHEIPLFDRLSVMKYWADQGVFDLYTATKKLDIAERVHDCLGRLLADFVIAAAKTEELPAQQGGR